jgi:predicted RecA/RadA family phage recombinase
MATTGTRDNSSGVLSLTAPTGGVTQGKIYSIGNMLVVAMETASATATFAASYRGPTWILKYGATGQSFVAGAKCYADLTNHRITASSTGNTLVGGFVIAAAAATDTAVLVDLCGPSPALT